MKRDQLLLIDQILRSRFLLDERGRVSIKATWSNAQLTDDIYDEYVRTVEFTNRLDVRSKATVLDYVKEVAGFYRHKAKRRRSQ